MRVFVTGASGYIGRYIVDELIEQGHEIIGLVRKTSLKNKNIEIVKGDITKPAELKSVFQDVDAVIHNAAYATDWGDKREIFYHNVEGTRNIASLCSEYEINHVVYTSSAGVYGFPNLQNELTEDSPLRPFNLYHKSKMKGETVFRDFPKLTVSIIRPPLVIGCGGKAGKIITKGIKQGILRYVGSGENVTSFVHPKDVAQCLRLALEKDKKGDIFNVVSFTCQIKKFFNVLARELNVEPPEKKISSKLAYTLAFFMELFSSGEPSLTRYRVKLMCTTRRISDKKAKKELKYSPLFDLDTTVRDMVSYYKRC